jgi:hypothetical protein
VIASHRDFDGIKDIELLSISLSGNPSGVSTAVVRVIYIDGTSEERVLKPNSNEVIYETFIEEFQRLKGLLAERSK